MGSVRLLKASAGSGKTYQLAYRYVKAVVENPAQYRHILAVTFTNKATEEMKRRILAELDTLARLNKADVKSHYENNSKSSGYLSQLREKLGLDTKTIVERAILARTRILHDYSHFAVLTIDKFFQRIIRSFVRELGMDLNFEIELRTENLLSRAADAVIDDITLNDALRRWFVAFIDEKMGESRNWDVKTGLVRLGGELMREGVRDSMQHSTSGDKPHENQIDTREQLEKIVRSASAEATKIKAKMSALASEALELMKKHGLQPSDFSGGARSFANYFVKTAAGEIDQPGASVRAAVDNSEKWYAKTSPSKSAIMALHPRLQPLLEQICMLYDTNIKFLNSSDIIRSNYRNFALLSDLSDKMAEICREEGILPIAETNNILHRLISGNDTPFIFEKVGNHYLRFMIDEFQDTSARQWENFVPLLHNALAQAADDPVLLVGDVKQSIYRWRGGDWRILASDIERRFGHIESVDLTTNYRSLPGIVQFNNNLIEACVEADNAALNARLDQALASGAIDAPRREALGNILSMAYTAHTQQTPDNGKIGGYTSITTYGKDAQGIYTPPVISMVEELQRRGYAPGDIAILVRVNNQGAAIADMLLDHKRRNPDNGFCYDVVTQEALLINSSAAVGFVLACFRLAESPNDNIALAVYNHWLEQEADTPLKDSDFFRTLRLTTPSEAFEMVYAHYHLASREQETAYLQAFHEQILKFTSSTVGDLPLLLKWWEENGRDKSVYVPQGRTAINITSIHKSKGLQYKAVIIPYCDWNLGPKANSTLWARAERSEAKTDAEVGGDEVGGDTESGAVHTKSSFELPEYAMPVGISEKLANSCYAGDYFTEFVFSHVDNINLFYVAVTRAMEELHIMMSERSAKMSGKISSLITNTITLSKEDTVELGGDNGLTGKLKALLGTASVIAFGEPIINEPYAKTKTATPCDETVLPLPYRSFEIGNRLKLKLRHKRYLDEHIDAETVISPRNFGILMHRAFESATNSDDIYAALSHMQSDGIIAPAEQERLKATIEHSLSDPIVSSWFNGSWEAVRNENNIIVPGDTILRRPDRVMIKGRNATVVDYKFGDKRQASYKAQLRRYMSLLREMGYSDVKGYIWYTILGHIEVIDEQ